MRHRSNLSGKQLPWQQPSGRVGAKLAPEGAKEIQELEPVNAGGLYKGVIRHSACQEQRKHPGKAHHLHSSALYFNALATVSTEQCHLC